MILIAGGTGYIGSAFVRECVERKLEAKVIRHAQNLHEDELTNLFKAHQADTLINCAAFIPQPTVNACSDHKDKTLIGNVLFPMRLSLVCARMNVRLAHLSTACLYDEARFYREDEAPTRRWDGYCGFYLRTKFKAEETVRHWEKHWIFRIRLPFDEVSNPRNYLSKLVKYPQVWDHTNSLTHRGDFVKAALDLMAAKAPYGTYHMTNPGVITAREIVDLMGLKGKTFVSGPCTGTTLNTDKLEATEVQLRPVRVAVENSIPLQTHV